ncbi:MAG: N-methylhydantoinase [Solirubrobacteraceae bacterium]|nr:N-methylhydantoinase [Solirubrobacteraceae bacterium]
MTTQSMTTHRPSAAGDAGSGFRIAVDTGGTFTDVVVSDARGDRTTAKARTTPDRIFDGMREGIGVAAQSLGLSLEELLGATSLLVYATTRAVNAIIESTTARTVFLVTEGFPDVLVLREGGKANPFDFVTPYPEPYVPRRLTFEVRERVGAGGEVLRPLDEDQAREALRRARAAGAEAAAVCLLWSIANPVHEHALARLIGEELPGVPVTLSHRLNPTVREYRRASSAAIDASLKPLMQEHLREMERDLAGAGFGGEILVATSSGGAMDVEDVIRAPIYSIRSGPAMAPVGGRAAALAAEVPQRDVIVADTGGTTFDVTLVRDGAITVTNETWLGEQYTGHMTGLTAVDVRSIGAGGGSIAWVDEGGLLRVGPQSAGADPGPACYGRGGAAPTVTDAALVLGYLSGENFLGGRMDLDAGAAGAALDGLAAELGSTAEATADAILTVINEHMVGAIEEITVNEGVDPRGSLLVAGGGAAGLNIVQIARQLGTSEVLVPRAAGALSATGIHHSDLIADEKATGFARSADFDTERVNALLAELRARLDGFVERLQGRGVDGVTTEYFVDARYEYQLWELEIPVPVQRFSGPGDVAALVDAFHAAHERVFAVSEPGQDVEFTSWRVRVTASLAGAPPGSRAPAPGAAVTPRTTRRAYFAETGWVDVPVFTGDALLPGARVDGPAVIEEPTTTLVLYPRSVATATSSESYAVRLDLSDPTAGSVVA